MVHVKSEPATQASVCLGLLSLVTSCIYLKFMKISRRCMPKHWR